MGACGNYCGSCGEDPNQIQTDKSIAAGAMGNHHLVSNHVKGGGMDHFGFDQGNQPANSYVLAQADGEVVDDEGRVAKGPIPLKNGAIYTGEWLNAQRDGHGNQVWPDKSKYEGFWRNDKANGQGKLVHADGDIYEGQWVNDKAHGKGTYSHANGAFYNGDWIDDK